MRLHRSIVLGVAVALLAASPAAAQQDLRSPDTRDAAAASIAANAPQDLRSPDTRDAADGRGTFSAPDVTVVKVPQPVDGPAPATGIEWSDAGIGAAFMLALVAVIGLAVRHRRQSAPQAAISA
jgi:hypothetical protein